MFEDFLAFAKENKLFEKGDSVLVGVSGGVDSVVLLDILIKLKEKLGVEVAVAHVNYGLRKESDRDNKFVKDLAGKYGLPFFDKKVKLAGGNIEERARDIRYGFFNETAEREGFDKIAVAHHKNDIVETFFLNLSRGSGLTGLVSMRPKTNLNDLDASPHTRYVDSRLHGNDKRRKVGPPSELPNHCLIRPLLFAAKQEVEKYAKENRLKFVEDATNKDISFKRNLIRHKIIPELEKINPELVEAIAAEADDLREAQKAVAETVAKYYKKLAGEAKRSVSFSVKELAKVSPYFQSEILRESIRYVKGDLRDISRKNIEDALNLFKEAHGTKEIHLGEGLIVRRTYDKLEVGKEVKSPAQKPKSIRLEMEKESVFGEWRLFLGKQIRKNINQSKNLVFLDIQKAPTLHVRCRKPGDKIPIDGGKTKSLQDVFVDAKIPRDERDAYPVVTGIEDEVIWIPGLRVNPNYKESKKSKNLAAIEATKYEKTN